MQHSWGENSTRLALSYNTLGLVPSSTFHVVNQRQSLDCSGCSPQRGKLHETNPGVGAATVGDSAAADAVSTAAAASAAVPDELCTSPLVEAPGVATDSGDAAAVAAADVSRRCCANRCT